MMIIKLEYVPCRAKELFLYGRCCKSMKIVVYRPVRKADAFDWLPIKARD